MFARDKHSSLFAQNVSDESKKFYNSDTWSSTSRSYDVKVMNVELQVTPSAAHRCQESVL